MTAAAEPQPGYDPDDPMGQLVGDVDALRRKLDEQGATLRRSHQALTALAESVGKMVEQQRKRDRRRSVDSFVAYILFTVLVAGGALLLYRSRVGDLERGRADAITDRDAARKQLEVVQKQARDRDDAAARAYATYQAVVAGRRSDVLAQVPELASLPLSPTERDVLADAVKQAKAHQLDEAIASGADAARRGEYAHAVTELRKAALLGPPTAALHYWLGVSLVRGQAGVADAAGAVDELRAALTAKTDQQDARYWLAVALEAAGKPADARKEYEKFAAGQPMAPYAAQARQRWVELGQPQ
jgi:Flp pilus assembly protein TadD